MDSKKEKKNSGVRTTDRRSGQLGTQLVRCCLLACLRAHSASSQRVWLPSLPCAVADSTGCVSVSLLLRLAWRHPSRGGAAVLTRQTFQALAECFLNHVCAQVPFLLVQQWHRAASCSRSSVLSPPAVGNWLLLSSALVIVVIVVGGITRLAESGLSIIEWQPITGVLPPLLWAEWENAFDKYKSTPEFRLCTSQRARHARVLHGAFGA